MIFHKENEQVGKPEKNSTSSLQAVCGWYFLLLLFWEIIVFLLRSSTDRMFVKLSTPIMEGNLLYSNSVNLNVKLPKISCETYIHRNI